ncbi:DUF6888 family protein [Crocosphaera chwakensis]|uniref:DUF6888 domain-containing protein n=1 Tax=Crocosphaera chwakensis CCY0110 TaxID=391612 RepID=A3IXG9_9CHRO|nr:hypothetical protein [Crocosphaera chwakensis]EAZ88816.1 hypothetical protein CY0110_11877 [Crocosphaera chwakensis CCY0110]
MPTEKQAVKCFLMCQQITQMYLPVFLVRLDERTNDIFILAGEDIQILIDNEGDVTIL